MGSKDYQQCMVVQRLLAIMALPTTLHRCPILREPDGLAMSSRNTRLNPVQRKNALAIYRALQAIKEGWSAGTPVTQLIAEATTILEAASFRVDYVSIADAATLEPLPADAVAPSDHLRNAGSAGHSSAVALIAAFQGEVRLIDNMVLSPANQSPGI
jgi:pantoate--beta-alanine ligase